MSKSAGGASSVSKEPRRRQPVRGPAKLDLFAEAGAPGSLINPILGDALPSGAARRAGRKRLADALIPDQPASDGEKIGASGAANARTTSLQEFSSGADEVQELRKQLTAKDAELAAAQEQLAAKDVDLAAVQEQLRELRARVQPPGEAAARGSVKKLLRELKVCRRVSIDDSLEGHPTLVRALEMAAKPNPKVEDGNDDAAGAAALSLIIGCARQESRAQLVIELLGHGLGTWPLVGCEFDHLSLRPPLLAALEAYKTFEDKTEWHKMFDALADRGDLDTCYGPELLTAASVYFDKFQKNYAPESSVDGDDDDDDE